MRKEITFGSSKCKPSRFILSKSKVLTLITCLATVLSISLGLFSTTAAAPLSYGYPTADQQLTAGMAASYVGTSGKVKSVERSVSGAKNEFAGIVLNVQSVSSNTGETREAYIVTSGQTEAYVSSVNGTIQKGDYLVLSPLQGILMHSSTASGAIVGTALADLSSQNSSPKQIQKSNGGYESVQVAELPIDLNARGAAPAQHGSSFFGNLLNKSGSETVNAIRLIGALALFLIVLVIEGVIIYSAVSSSITSAGRNPLAKKIIYKTLTRVFFLAAAILILGLGAIYIILKI